MRIILRRRLSPKSASHPPEYRQSVLQVSRLKIGRAADQHIQLDHPQIKPRQAILYRLFGRLRVRAVGDGQVVVNGVARRRCSLQSGDRLTFDAVRLTVEQVRPDGVIVLRLNDPGALAADRIDSPDHVSLKGTGLDPRAWSWRLVLGVLGIGFALPCAVALMGPLRTTLRAAPLLPSDTLWLPGPLHAAHRAIGDDCNVCHTRRFARVTNAACMACHQTVQHHVVTTAPTARLFDDHRCADCHGEHDAQKSLVDAGTTGCVACHEDLRALVPDTQLGDVRDFSRRHPEFSLTVLEPASSPAAAWRSVTIPANQRADARQSSNLTFSHQVHLDPAGIDSPEGRQKLGCTNCHQTDASGRTMQPIRMQTHCERCHRLQFDESDPTSKVPHGDLPQLYKALQEHFSRTFLDREASRPAAPAGNRRVPGGEDKVLTRDEQRRALKWADAQSTAVLHELLQKRVCVECHKITRDEAQSDPTQWRVEPVRLTEHWFPRAEFSHAVHDTSTCATCHRGVTSSDDSTAIHMPTLAACRECHSDDDRRKVASSCIMCHDFHNAGRGAFTALDPPARQDARP